MERRLAAILAADVVGYSRLVEADEEATVRALDACRRVIDGLVSAHHGRIFGSAGDSVIAEFASPVEAVRCAVEIQQRLEGEAAAVEADRRMRLRIGINLGDVIVDGDDLLGDAVNIAARLEPLAPPGGICLSRAVLDQVRKQPDLGFEDLGDHKVKNIAEPVRVYRVLTEPGAAGRVIGSAQPAGRSRAGLLVAAGALVLAAGLAALFWWEPWQRPVETAALETIGLPLPDKPSVAVLPFANISGDDGHDHVADGLTEDIVATLSQVSSLFVIGRQSTGVYKDTQAEAQQIARDLGVRHILEGSVQVAGDQVRVTAQLIDGTSGKHVWAERYDREMTDLFTLLDEITDQIVVALRVQLAEGEETLQYRRHTNSIQAWRHLSRALEHLYRGTKPDNVQARQWLEKAVAVDADYALAYALIAFSHWLDAFHGWSDDAGTSIGQATELGEKARALDPTLPVVNALQGVILLFQRRYDEAIAAAEKAVDASPNNATNTAILAMILRNAGRPADAIQTYKAAMRLSPYYPAWYLEDLGFAYLGAKRPGEALAAFGKFLEREPDGVHAAHAHVGRALAYYTLGQEQDARNEVALAVERDKEISVGQFGELSLSKDKKAVERGLAILRELGLPE